MERSASLNLQKARYSRYLATLKLRGVSNRAGIMVDVRLDANLADCAHIVTDPARNGLVLKIS
jgi:hypothetical protein